ncbi:MAG: hypothetical protein JWL94_1640 [Microbacteriaceae bacterium]|jgi:hypothetical protein|nr:hypothetical protein [Microbacteriaceae bacterium]
MSEMRGVIGRIGVVGVMVAVGGGLAGCAAVVPTEAIRVNPPATIEEIEGEELSRITLTRRGAERLGLATATMEAAENGRFTVQYSSLLYDASGGTWVYTNPEPLVFLRAGVTVSRIDGNLVHITDGPPAGMEVVTVGAAELFGAELDTAD